MQQPRLIILEGNISAGKTSLARNLGNLLNAEVFLEPTLVNPYLDKYYAEPKKYALVMQLWLLRNRFQTYLTAIRNIIENGKSVILDRSVYSDYVFAVKNHMDKNINDEGFQYYLKLRAKMLDDLPVPQVTVYLDVSPQECFRRVHNLRCRDCETGIPLQYLAGLDECYHKFLGLMRQMGSYVLCYDWTEFGNAARVSKDVLNAPVADYVNKVNWEELTKLLYNPALIHDKMHLDTTLDELREVDLESTPSYVVETGSTLLAKEESSSSSSAAATTSTSAAPTATAPTTPAATASPHKEISVHS